MWANSTTWGRWHCSRPTASRWTSRDDAGKERLPLFDNERGEYRCHTITNCSEACPEELNPTEGIQWLKKAAVRRRLFGRTK